MKIDSQEELTELAKDLLDFKGFKRTRFLNDSGADEGRDIEAYTIGIDESGTNYQWKWWIELKFRSKGYLSVADLRTKISNAGARRANFFLLITNVPVPIRTQEELESAAYEARVQFRLWDRNKLNELEAERIKLKVPRDVHRVEISDRLNEIAALKGAIHSRDYSVIFIQGAGGVGKSALSRFLIYHLQRDYGCGLIDCRLSADFGFAFKMLADSFRRQGADSRFAYSANDRLQETQRLELFFEHSSERPTLLLIDNLEEVLGPKGELAHSLVRDLIDRFLQHNMRGSLIILTSRANIADRRITSNERFFTLRLKGWDMAFVLDEYLPTADYLFTRLGELGDDRKLREEQLALFKGNPLALKIANQLCANYRLREMVELLPKGVDPAQGLVEAFSRELDPFEIEALEIIAQLDRPLTKQEIHHLICSEETLRSLILRQLVETSDSKDSQYQLHPITADHFSLNDRPDHRRKVVLALVQRIYTLVDSSLLGIDNSYNHFLLRQAARLLVQVEESESAGEILLRIGTRAVSMGDVGFLEHMLELVEPKISRLSRAKLLKVRGHIHDLRGDLKRATEVYQAMLDEGEALEDLWVRAAALNGLGTMLRHMGEPERAVSLYYESLALREATADLVGQSNSHHNIGAIHLECHRPKLAQQHLKKALAIRRQLKDKFRMSASQLYLSECYCELKNFPEARRQLNECLKIKHELDDIVGILWARLLRIKIALLDHKDDRSLLEDDIAWCLDCAERLEKARDIMLGNAFAGVYALLMADDEAAALKHLIKARSIAKSLQNSQQLGHLSALLQGIAGGLDVSFIAKSAIKLTSNLKI